MFIIVRFFNRTTAGTLSSVDTAPPTVIEQGIQDIIEGAIYGEFIANDEMNILHMVGMVGMGFIPIAGQIGDVRDTIAIIDKYSRGEATLWDVTLQGAALIPGIGDAAKLAGKFGGDMVNSSTFKLLENASMGLMTGADVHGATTATYNAIMTGEIDAMSAFEIIMAGLEPGGALVQMGRGRLSRALAGDGYNTFTSNTPEGGSVTRKFNDDGNLVSESNYDPRTNQTTTQFADGTQQITSHTDGTSATYTAIEGGGNQVTHRDANGNVTSMNSYDADGTLRREIKPADGGGFTQTAYDENGNVTATSVTELLQGSTGTRTVTTDHTMGQTTLEITNNDGQTARFDNVTDVTQIDIMLSSAQVADAIHHYTPDHYASFVEF